MVAGNWLVVQRLVTTLAFQMMLIIWRLVQRVYWQLNGVQQQRQEAHLPQNYERCAHVLDVVMCHKFCESQMILTAWEFLLAHNRFENPQYIIDNDNITLMEVNDQYAVFSETKNKGMHLWRAEYSSFIRTAQLSYTHRVIVVPLTAFHRMSETVGDPKANIIFLFNTGRCGSTLFNQVMECTGHVVTISEPDSLNKVSKMYQRFGDTAEVRQFARDIVRWICRPYTLVDIAPLAYMIKIAAPSAVILPILRDLYPASRCMFMYREIVKTSKSLYRMSQGLPMVRMLFILGRLSGGVSEQIMETIGYAGSDFRVRLDNDLLMGIMLSVVTTKVYLDTRSEGVDVKALRYEDLVAKPLETCRAIMEYCKLPASLAESAVKGLELDSQRATPIARSIIGAYPEPELTPAMKAKFNERLKQFGQPLIGEDNILEGTLTHC